MQGSFKWWNDRRGFGFLDAGGREYFAHITHVASGLEPVVGMQVEFIPKTTERGEMATNIRLLDGKEAEVEAAYAKHVRMGDTL